MSKAAAECQPPFSCQSSAKTVRIFKPAFSPHFQTGANNSLVSRDTVEQDFALKRQLFLCEQGYQYAIWNLDNPNGTTLAGQFFGDTLPK
jgi:hypothetical protein